MKSGKSPERGDCGEERHRHRDRSSDIRPDQFIVEIHKKASPFGPPMDIRLSPAELLSAMGMLAVRIVNIGEYFYMQTMATG
jgi:hypothetical protein